MLRILLLGALLAASVNDDLLDAVRKSDAVAVKALLAKGASANAKYRYDRSILSFAADRGSLEVVKLLLDAGADPNTKDTFYSASAMTWAVAKNHADIVRALLQKGATEGGDAALTMAATRGHVDIVKTLLDRGGMKQPQLDGALARAIRNNHTEIAEMLKKAGAVPPPKADFQVDEATLKSYAGAYKGEAGELNLILKDGKLFGAPAGQPPTPLGAVDRVTFVPTQMDGITLTFDMRDGAVSGVTLKQGTNVRTYKKVEVR